MADAVAVEVVERVGRTGIAEVADPVRVAVFLTRIRKVGAVVAGIPQPVRVDVVLVRVDEARTVVRAFTDSVTVDVVGGIVRTDVAGIPQPVRIPVRLVRVGHRRAVVQLVGPAVRVRVRRGRGDHDLVQRRQPASGSGLHRQTAVRHLDQHAALQELARRRHLTVDERNTLDHNSLRTLTPVGIAHRKPDLVEPVGQIQLPAPRHHAEDERLPDLRQVRIALPRGKRPVPAVAPALVVQLAAVGQVARRHLHAGRLEVHRDQCLDFRRNLQRLDEVDHRPAAAATEAQLEQAVAHGNPHGGLGELPCRGRHVVDHGQTAGRDAVRALREAGVAGDDAHVVVAVGQLGGPGLDTEAEREGVALRRSRRLPVPRRKRAGPAVAPRGIERRAAVLLVARGALGAGG